MCYYSGTCLVCVITVGPVYGMSYYSGTCLVCVITVGPV